MTEETQVQPGVTAAEAVTESASDGAALEGAEARQYTQAELDKLFTERGKRAQDKLLKSLGFTTLEDARAAIGRLQQLDESQKTEVEKLRDQATKAQALADEREKQTREIRAEYEFRILAADLGAQNAKAAQTAWQLVDKTAIEYNDDGKPTNAKHLLAEVLKEHDYLRTPKPATNAGAGTASPPNTSKPTMNDIIRGMAGRKI